MSDPTIFQNGSTTAAPSATVAATAQTDDPAATLLSMILNENGQQKYASVQEALKGAAHAQTYIAQLQTKLAAEQAEKDRLAAQAAKAAELENTVAQLMARQTNSSTTQTPNDLSPDKIAELVAQTLDKRSAAEKAKANQDVVVSKLLEVFGEDAEKKYNAAAQELGLTVIEMNEMAAKSPKAVLKALGVAEQQANKPNLNTFAPASTTLNTASFQPQQDSFVKRNAQPPKLGATTRELQSETINARKMVDEIHAQGMEVGDLADPKVYFKLFS